MSAAIVLRPYQEADEAGATALWQRTWQTAYPDIDFAARLTWWRERWRADLVPRCHIVVAESGATLAGFITLDPRDGEIDQLVVAPEHWGANVAAMLMNKAKRLMPSGLHLAVNQDNARALAFYRKHGFVITDESVNALSGRPVFVMRWGPE